jgi:Leucine-rich repeat (LRR) protein
VRPPRLALDFYRQRLGRVPDVVWDHPDATSLVLAENDLTALPERVGELRRLVMLDLGHNRLTSIPPELGELTGLSELLYLHDNALESLPQALGA